MRKVSNRCKNCKDLYKYHVDYMLEEWDSKQETRFINAGVQLAEMKCFNFEPMTNLDYLEWKYGQRKTL